MHVREDGRFNQRYPLLCRDYLRATPAAAAAYVEVKRPLAARFPDDRETYADVKDPVFDVLMAGAEAWARRHGLDDRTGRCLTPRPSCAAGCGAARADRTEHERGRTSRPRSPQHAAALAGATIAAFVGVRSEPPTVPLLEALHARGVRVLLPVLLADMDLDWARSPAPPTWRRAGCGCWSRSARRSAATRSRQPTSCWCRRSPSTGRSAARPGRRLVRPGAASRTSAPVVAVVFGDEVLEYAAGRAPRPIGGRRR